MKYQVNTHMCITRTPFAPKLCHELRLDWKIVALIDTAGLLLSLKTSGNETGRLQIKIFPIYTLKTMSICFISISVKWENLNEFLNLRCDFRPVIRILSSRADPLSWLLQSHHPIIEQVWSQYLSDFSATRHAFQHFSRMNQCVPQPWFDNATIYQYYRDTPFHCTPCT